MGSWPTHKLKNHKKIASLPIFPKFGTQKVDRISQSLSEFVTLSPLFEQFVFHNHQNCTETAAPSCEFANDTSDARCCWIICHTKDKCISSAFLPEMVDGFSNGLSYERRGCKFHTCEVQCGCVYVALNPLLERIIFRNGHQNCTETASPWCEFANDTSDACCCWIICHTKDKGISSAFLPEMVDGFSNGLSY